MMGTAAGAGARASRVARLDLGGNPIGDGGVAAICASLRGAAAVAAAVLGGGTGSGGGSGGGLEELGLEGCGIGDTGAG